MISKSSLFYKILDIDIFLAIQRSEAFGFKPHYSAPSTDHLESLKRCIVLVMAPTHIDMCMYIYIHTCICHRVVQPLSLPSPLVEPVDPFYGGAAY